MRLGILGAGITGLSCAWFLKKYYPSLRIIILEKESRAGGSIQTINKNGFLFEVGPHSLRLTSKSAALIDLIEDLQLQSEIILPEKSAKRRFLFCNNKLSSFPTSFWNLLTSPMTYPLCKAIYHDLISVREFHEDESIFSFAKRRFGLEATELFVDPLISGIYAGNIHQLSVKTCMPLWIECERRSQSILRCMLPKKSKPKRNLEKFLHNSPLFSFKEGLETLIKSLSDALKDIIFNSIEIFSLEKNLNEIELSTSRGVFKVDHVISALPAQNLAKVLQQHSICDSLLKMKSETVGIVNLGYRSKILTKEGFGYLIPQREKQDILGCIWDSSIFPLQNKSEAETRLTVLLGGAHHDINTISHNDLLKMSLNSVRNHMGIEKEPDIYHVSIARHSIPQYFVGFEALLHKFKADLSEHYPFLSCLGSSFNGVSVVDCIAHAELFARQFELNTQRLKEHK